MDTERPSNTKGVHRDINLRIHKERITITLPANNEEAEQYLREASTLTNKLLEEYRHRYPGITNETAITYVALHLGRDLCALRHRVSEDETDQRLRELLHRIETTLGLSPADDNTR